MRLLATISAVLIMLGCSENPTSTNEEAKPTFEELEACILQDSSLVLAEYDNSLARLQIINLPAPEDDQHLDQDYILIYNEDTLLSFSSYHGGEWFGYASINGDDYFYLLFSPWPYGEFHFYINGEEFLDKRLLGFTEWKDGLYALAYEDGHIRAHNRETVMCLYDPQAKTMEEIGRKSRE